MISTVGSDDEFRFRNEEAAEFGISLPREPVSRENGHDDDGRLVSFIRHGSARDSDNPVVVFLHGAALNAHTWDATAAALGETAIALDLPGHGDSEWHEDADYRAVALAASVAPVVRSFDGAQVLVGQSLGGLTAALLAAESPSDVTALMLVDITPDVGAEEASPVAAFLAGPPDFASRDDIVDAARAAGIGTSRASVARGVALNTRVRDDGRVVFSHHLGNLDGFSPTLHSDPDRLWAALESLSVPVWLVRARRGFVNDDLAEAFRTRLPQSRVITIDTGHNVQEDDPVGLARVIRDLLTHLEVRSPASESTDA